MGALTKGTTYTFVLTVSDGDKSSSDTIKVGVGNPLLHNIPGKIEAESYDEMFGIKTEPTTDTGLGENVGYTDPNDWLSYNVLVSESGKYNVSIRVASNVATGALQLKVGNTEIMTSKVENTSGWQAWITKTAEVTLTKGVNTLRVNFTGAGVNLNWIDFTLISLTTDIEDSSPNTPQLKLYPNPTSGYLYMSTEENTNIKAIEVFDTFGEVIISTNMPVLNFIDLTNYNNGIYFIKTTTENAIVTEKIVKRQ